MWKKYRSQGVQVLVVDVQEPRKAALKYAKHSKFTFPVLLDSKGSVSLSFAPDSFQTDLPREQVAIASNLLIDRNGVIRFNSLLDSAHFDARLTALTAKLEEILAERK